MIRLISMAFWQLDMNTISSFLLLSQSNFSVPKGKVAYLFSAAADQHTYLDLNNKSIENVF